MKLMKTVAFIFVSVYSMSCVHAVFFFCKIGCTFDSWSNYNTINV